MSQDKSIRELQASLPWTGHYHRDFRSSPMTHKDFAHALLHITKASGGLAAIINEAEHGGYEWANKSNRKEVAKFVADMVICALRMANTCPEGVIDLQSAVEERIRDKDNQLASTGKWEDVESITPMLGDIKLVQGKDGAWRMPEQCPARFHEAHWHEKGNTLVLGLGHRCVRKTGHSEQHTL